MKVEYFNINGGYGRCLASTGVIKEYKEKNPDIEINIVTGYPEIFLNNPYINKVYSINHEYLFEDHINGHEYKEPEPYKLQGYINGDMHLVNGFSQEIFGEDKFIKPEIYLTENELDEAEQFIKSVDKPVILFQPFGSTGGKSRDGKTIMQDSSFRSLPIDFAKKLYDKLSDKYQVVFIRSPDQASPSEKWMTMPNMPLRKIISLIPYVHAVIGVDSSIQHACASLDKKAIVFWGSTNSNQLGYDTNLNFEGQVRKIQYNPVRVPGNDYDVEKRYKNVWNYLNDSIINKVMEEVDGKISTE